MAVNSGFLQQSSGKHETSLQRRLPVSIPVYSISPFHSGERPCNFRQDDQHRRLIPLNLEARAPIAGIEAEDTHASIVCRSCGMRSLELGNVRLPSFELGKAFPSRVQIK